MKSKLINGDSTEILKQLPEQSFHAIISDIPYGIGHDDWDILHNNSNSAFCGASRAQLFAGTIFKRRGKPLNGWCEADKMIPLEYQSWCASWAPLWLRVLKPGASCFIFAGRRFAHRCISAMEDAGFTFKDELGWEKNSAPHRAQRLSVIFDKRSDIANSEKWRNWRVANLRPLFEPILWFQKPYKLGSTIADNVKIYEIGGWNEEALTKRNQQYDKIAIHSNLIRVEEGRGDHGLHSAQKPLKLMQLLIDLVTIPNQIVLDPFMGSGTTCLAAKRLNRHYIGIDIDEKNVTIAKARLEDTTLDMHASRRNLFYLRND